MTTAIETLRTLINSLGFTEVEKDALRKYFIGNEKRQNDALAFLPDYTTDEAKLVFLRSLIPTSGMFSQSKYKIMCLTSLFLRCYFSFSVIFANNTEYLLNLV